MLGHLYLAQLVDSSSGNLAKFRWKEHSTKHMMYLVSTCKPPQMVKVCGKKSWWDFGCAWQDMLTADLTMKSSFLLKVQISLGFYKHFLHLMQMAQLGNSFRVKRQDCLVYHFISTAATASRFATSWGLTPRLTASICGNRWIYNTHLPHGSQF